MTKTVTVRMARPDREEIKSLYALMHAAEAIDNRWSRETPEEFKERMHDRELSEEEEAFILMAWDILTNKHSGALGRILGAYSTLSATFADESLDYVAASPAINAMYNDSLILPELVEGFEEAMAHSAMLNAKLAAAEEKSDRKNPPFLKLRMKKGRASEGKLSKSIPLRGQRISMRMDEALKKITIYPNPSGAKLGSYGTFACPPEFYEKVGRERIYLNQEPDGYWHGYFGQYQTNIITQLGVENEQMKCRQ